MVELHTLDVATMRRAAEVLASLGMAEPSTDPATRRCSLAAPGGSKLLPIVIRALDEAEVPVEDIALRRPTLDEVFLALTGRSAGDGDRVDGDADGDETKQSNDNDPTSPREGEAA